MSAGIVILGAGVMGSALAVPAAENGHEVLLVGSPLDDGIIAELAAGNEHPTLRCRLPAGIRPISDAALSGERLAAADVVVLGVSSPGVDWAVQRLLDADAHPGLLTLVTKGLVADGHRLLTYADALPHKLGCALPQLVGIGGPCIARELALGYPTRVTFAAADIVMAERLRDLLQTPTYRVQVSTDVIGVEACAALKNFLCIGVSAMFSTHALDDGHAKNPVAALYNQAVLELAVLSDWVRGRTVASPGTAFDLAGMGDLHVTVGGGRNSRLGRHLGEGQSLQSIMTGPMHGITVEGVDTGRQLAACLRDACDQGLLVRDVIPLTLAILDCIEHDALFALDFTQLPG